MKVLILDTLRYEIVKEETIPSCTIVGGMYVKELKLIPVAFVALAEHREAIEKLFKEMKERKQKFDREEWTDLMLLSKYRP